MSRETICLYVCSIHLYEVLIKIQFGTGIAEILKSGAGVCNYCKRQCKARMFLYKDFCYVEEWMKENPRKWES